MKIHTFIISLIVLMCSSCKVTSYEYVETLELPIVDTVEIPSIHHHYVEDSSHKCVYHTSMVFHESDTIFIDIYQLRTRRAIKPKQR